jgi:antirestriction protein ArdC
MRSKSRGVFADLHKPAALRLFLHMMICCGLLEVLRSDKRAIFTVASKAQEIADWMHARQANAHRHEVRDAA